MVALTLPSPKALCTSCLCPVSTASSAISRLSPFCYHKLQGGGLGTNPQRGKARAHCHPEVSRLSSRRGLLSFLQVPRGHRLPTAFSSSNNQNTWTCPINRRFTEDTAELLAFPGGWRALHILRGKKNRAWAVSQKTGSQGKNGELVTYNSAFSL